MILIYGKEKKRLKTQKKSIKNYNTIFRINRSFAMVLKLLFLLVSIIQCNKKKNLILNFLIKINFVIVFFIDLYDPKMQNLKNYETIFFYNIYIEILVISLNLVINFNYIYIIYLYNIVILQLYIIACYIYIYFFIIHINYSSS